MIILHVFVIILTFHLIKPSTFWMRKEAQNIKPDNIISKYENIAITSCMINCDNEKRCKSIGLEEDAKLGDLVDCYLLEKEYISDSETNSFKLIIVEKMNELPKKSSTVKKEIPLSCQTLYESNPNLKSGMYRINPSNPINVYCNMGYASKGWMMITNVTVTSPLTEAEADVLTAKDKMSNSITELEQIGSGRFRFNPKYLSELDADFQFLHFFCTKPDGTTVSIRTTNKNILDYYMYKTDVSTSACGSFERDQNDDSTLTSECNRWIRKSWAGRKQELDRIYYNTFYTTTRHHFMLARGRMECDDYKDISRLFGTWQISVV